MMDEIIDVEFTAAIKDFIVSRGYTHLLYKGADESEPNPESKKLNHWLVPLKAEDPKIREGEPGHRVVEIQGDEVEMMAKGKPNVQFMIKMPLEDHIVFLKDR